MTHAKSSHVDFNECGLCYEAFGPADEVVYCTRAHLFHTHCFDEKFEDVSIESKATLTLKCPTCGSRMHGLDQESVTSTRL